MNKQVEVETSVGKWTIVKPKAGARNRALVKAETDSGNVKFSTLMTDLLPKCISSRPENFDKDVPIAQVLDDLEIEDYDLLVTALSKLLKEHETEEEKKT
jgi:hypothetical protein